ncbi:MAG: NAD-dependent epimerase/dehydratase family protein [Acidobacteria bacterium]|nr:NAD-dependent epimerase/dehydratase family protein [Acidobacteriota bacterium]
MEKVAIFGATGAVGRAVAAALERKGVPFRAVGRSRSKLENAFGALRYAEILEADLTDLRSAAAGARGADTLIYTVGVPLTAFHLHPKLMAVTLEAAALVQVQRVLVVSSNWSYGAPQSRLVAETHPRAPRTTKGRFRKQQEDLALEAQRDGKLQAMVVRLPDFFGPFADNSLANPVIRAALRGRTANWLGPLDARHEFLYVPDAGPVRVALAGRPDCYGEAWNLGGAGEITGRQFIELAYRVAERAPKFRTGGKWLLRIAGLVQPVMRELVEMYYLQEKPVILDESKLSLKLGGVHKTIYSDGIRQTLEWMRGAGRR